uniref:Contactin-associated protein-like 5 n=1 Tax=Seriola lalandi dorsalis TaxID=1841481 RepID=A0A3B4XHD2_SERLL
MADTKVEGRKNIDRTNSGSAVVPAADMTSLNSFLSVCWHLLVTDLRKMINFLQCSTLLYAPWFWCPVLSRGCTCLPVPSAWFTPGCNPHSGTEGRDKRGGECRDREETHTHTHTHTDRQLYLGEGSFVLSSFSKPGSFLHAQLGAVGFCYFSLCSFGLEIIGSHVIRLLLRFSSSRVAVTVGSLLDDQHWHSVVIERFNKQVNLTMDSHTQHFQTKGEGDSLEVDYELSFGGIPLPGKPGTFLRKNFHGCIENLNYNGINIIDLAKRRKPQIYTGNVTFSCSWPHLPACTFLSSSSSFLLLPAAAPSGLMAGFSVCFQFRTWNSEGLLLSVQLSRESWRLDLQISSSQLLLTLHSSGQQRSEASAGYRVNDGLWHSVNLDTRGLQITLILDSEPATTIEKWEQLEAIGNFYFGGCPPAGCPNLTLAFQGCIRLISINGQQVNLNHVQQRLLGNYNGLQFDTCNIRDRCLPNLCEHGGQCGQSWSSFSCDCSGTDYSGATCHNSIYETSCTAYKLIGSSSGLYTIDPDGSGPLGPTEVYCNMTEERVWTVMTHNVTAPVRVQGSSLQHPHIMKLKYSASAEQMRSIIMASEQCQQEVVYSCRKSRLFNTKGRIEIGGATGEASCLESSSAPAAWRRTPRGT